ncbi:hypothetical protein E3N88_40977 [Mikania micrantha]|uniref:alpha-1,2-Mannosidase n=1 Tax=Mikania micrantha TaxID=192012 RepID=A0A5N6LP33_9ASTR|nr:hypothetical protein E3N88_40977 [Mikania micrantha]
MARTRSSSSSILWRYINPAYYLKRPKSLALLFMAFVFVSFFVWDRQTLVREHEEEILTLKEEVEHLQIELEELKHEGDVSVKKTNTTAKTIGLTKINGLATDHIEDQRREKVKDAMVHAWTSYEKYAWGHDELQPQSKNGVDSFGGLGATIIDSLDTLYIMGLDEQFQRAKEWVANSLDFNKSYDASVFETTIRVVGGLLSAYDLSGDDVFLEKAKDIADRLLPAWNTPSGIPYNFINLVHGNAHNPGWTGGDSILADSGTEQLEFIALTQRTGDPKYQQKVEKVILVLNKTFPADGLLPIYINPHRGTTSHSTITFGAMGDSFYEYLLKVWIQGNKTAEVKHYREMWETSMKGLVSLVRKTAPSSFTYISEKIGNSLIDKMDELACFAPGMIALGSSGYGPDDSTKFLNLAEELAFTCYNFYQSTSTKLAGENYFFHSEQDMTVGTSWNILRPETVESLFYLWRLTGNKTYQEWGWNIFQAFETNSRVESGYVGLKDVNTGVKDNMMQSFFLAETLKYLYLLFSPPSVISLDEWVFNTEAHPLKIVPRIASGEEHLHTFSLPRRESFPATLIPYDANYRYSIHRSYITGTRKIKKIEVDDDHSQRAVTTALWCNFLVFSLKFGIWTVTSSHVMLAEVVHSVADFANQALLLYGLNSSKRAPDALHPYGYSKERFVWSLISAVGIFCLGSGATIVHGFQNLWTSQPPGNMMYAALVIGGSFIIEGASLAVAVHAVRKGAAAEGMTVRDYVWRGHDPTSVAVMTEDGAAVTGLLIAATSLVAVKMTGNPIYDPIGSIIVGHLLGVVAIFLIQRNRHALIGRAIDDHDMKRVLEFLKNDPVVDSVYDCKSEVIGPGFFRFKAEIDFNGVTLVQNYLSRTGPEEWAKKFRNAAEEKDDAEMLKIMSFYGEEVVTALGSEVDRLEKAIQEIVPGIRHVDIEAHNPVIPPP